MLRDVIAAKDLIAVLERRSPGNLLTITPSSEGATLDLCDWEYERLVSHDSIWGDTHTTSDRPDSLDAYARLMPEKTFMEGGVVALRGYTARAESLLARLRKLHPESKLGLDSAECALIELDTIEVIWIP